MSPLQNVFTMSGMLTMTGVVTYSQNARSLSTRASGALPAIKAALIAPIEIPATQSGVRLASASAW